MELGNNTILITGGATGIGLAFTERFVKAGSTVIVCGRREDKLKELRDKLPSVHTRVCDVSQESDRTALVEWVTREFPTLNALVNNAGVQRYPKVTQPEPWSSLQQEIAINIEAPMHLAWLLQPHLSKQKNPAIINVTSGLSFVPLAHAPIYSATKAAMRSFTLSLRHQLSQTPIKVIEIIPPAVNTDLGGPGLHTFGVPVDEFADSIMERIARGEVEVAYGFAEQGLNSVKQFVDTAFKKINEAPPEEARKFTSGGGK